MQTPPFVTGPFRLEDRSLVVKNPDVAVVFKNGVPLKPLGPGVHRAILNQLPLFGELDYLLFDAAPFGFDAVVDNIVLRDGTVVGVECGVWVTPSWLARPEVIFAYAEQFGLRAERYLQTVEVALRDIISRELRRSFSLLSHDEFLSLDLRALLDLKRVATQLATVTEVISVAPIADPAVVAAARQRQAIQQQRMQDDYTFERGKRQDEYDIVMTQRRDDYGIELSNRKQIAQANLHKEIGAILGVDAWSAAYPEAANEQRLQHARTLASLLTEYRDMLSPDDLRQATEALTGVSSREAPARAQLGARSLPEVAVAVRREVGENPAVLRSGVGVADAGGRVVVCVAAAVAPDADILPSPERFAAAMGAFEINTVEVTHFDGTAATAVDVLTGAFRQQGMPMGEIRIHDDSGSQLTVSLTGSFTDAELVAARLRAWVDALNEIVAPSSVNVEIETK